MATRITGTLIEWAEFGTKSWGRGRLRPERSDRDADHGLEEADVSIVGVIAGARVGYALDAEGQVELHPRFGEQFVIKRATVTAPRSTAGAVAWMAATLPMVGARRARALIDHFGGVDALWSAVTDAPERLTAVSGITLERAHEIRAAWVATQCDRESQIALRGWGLTDGQVGRCLKHYGDAGAAVERIRANPYELFHTVDGFGWVRADAVARASGVPADAPTRIDAAIDHVFAQACDAGHVFMRPGYVTKALFALLGTGVDPRTVRRAIARALSTGVIVKRGARVYTRRADASEGGLAELIGARLTA